jgi:hypothetical protein
MFQATRTGVSVPQMFMESGSSAQLSQNPINEPYRSQLNQPRNLTMYILVSVICCNISDPSALVSRDSLLPCELVC